MDQVKEFPVGMRMTYIPKEINMEELIKKMGFESVGEFHRLVATTDISSPEKLEAFKRWQEGDGTKDGLLKLTPHNNAAVS